MTEKRDGWRFFPSYSSACGALGRDGVKVNAVSFVYYQTADGVYAAPLSEGAAIREAACIPSAIPTQWIPVGENQPARDPQADEVLAATITGHVVATHPSRIDMLYKDAKRNGEECFYTHWMTMPKAPDVK